MDVFNYTIIVLIILGALIIGLAARYVRKIFDLLQDHQLKINWKRLRLFMLIFLGGYLGTVVVVIIGETNLLVLLSGVIFFMGALFVYLVVITGLDSFKKLNEVSQYNINQAKQIETINKELQEFLYVISHDLKSPIRGIHSLADFIEVDLSVNKTKNIQAYLDLLKGRALRMEYLINGLLIYSNAVNGKLEKEKIDLNQLLNEIYQNIQTPEGFEFKINRTLPLITERRQLIDQLFNQLIINGIKFNDKPKGVISIDYQDTGTHHEITLHDNGPGIPKKFHDKIFRIYSTLNSRESKESSGIGLAIVRKILNEIQGTIKIESQTNEGTKLMIYLKK